MAGAAELIMVEQTPCGWCDRWNEDVGAGYADTSQGRVAPLRRIDIHDPLPSDLGFIGNVRGTPTFVLVDEGKEIGRIRGYPGAKKFRTMLQRLLKKLPASPSDDTPLPEIDWSRAQVIDAVT